MTCAPGTAWDGNACVEITPECNSYVEIDPSPTENILIPARTTAKICYYVKLVNVLSNRDSQQVTPVRSDIIARDHDGETPRPRIMGERIVNIALAGERHVLLASNTAGTNRIRVDNFVLMEFTMNGQTGFWASGSADAPPPNGRITVGGVPVTNYQENAPSGANNYVPAHDLRPYLQLNTPVRLRGSALDCGGVAETSDIYLLFK